MRCLSQLASVTGLSKRTISGYSQSRCHYVTASRTASRPARLLNRAGYEAAPVRRIDRGGVANDPAKLLVAFLRHALSR